MNNFDIVKIQPKLVEKFKKLVDNGLLSHAYLFSGNADSGQLELALWISQKLLCKSISNNGMPCNNCSICKQIINQNHPDVLLVNKNDQSIRVNDIRFIKSEIIKSGMESNIRILIIQNSELLTLSAANSLLKMLENPNNNTFIFLLTNYKDKLLSTILSRVQTIFFPPVNSKRILHMFYNNFSNSDSEILIHLTNNLEEAKELINNYKLEDKIKFLWIWMDKIAQHDWNSFVIIQNDIMPLLKDRSHYKIFWKLISLAFNDILMYKWDSRYSLIFKNYQNIILKWINNYKDEKLVKQIYCFLGKERELELNMSFQTIMESLTLQLLLV